MSLKENSNKSPWGGTVREPESFATRNNPDKKSEALDPIMAPLQAAMSVPGGMQIANMAGNSKKDRADMDDNLTRIETMKAIITASTSYGKEPRVVADVVGCPISTFSRVVDVPRGGIFNLVAQWENQGLDTLLPFLKIQSPKTGRERRTMVLFGWGRSETLSNIEEELLRKFNPLSYCASFGPDSEDGVASFYVQVELFRNEIAEALGFAPDSKEVETIIKRQINRSHQAIRMRDQNKK